VTARTNSVGLTRENPAVVDLRIPVDGFLDEEADASVERGFWQTDDERAIPDTTHTLLDEHD
jgi:hypothetical protein